MSKETLRQLVEAEGRSVLGQMANGALMPSWSSVDCATDQETTRLYIGCDGVKVPLVTEEEKRKRRKGLREKRRRRGRKCKPLPRAKTGADCAYKDFKVAYSSFFRFVKAGEYELIWGGTDPCIGWNEPDDWGE